MYFQKITSSTTYTPPYTTYDASVIITPNKVVGVSLLAFLIPPYPTKATPLTMDMIPVQCYLKYYFLRTTIESNAVAATTDPFII